MAQVLIVYATRYGQTGRIAARMAERLREAGHEVELSPAALARVPQAGELVIVGAPVYAGRYPRTLRAWLRRVRDALGPGRGVFFNVSGSACSGDPRGREQALAHALHFLAELRWEPARVEAFAGAIPYTRYGWLTRWMMRRIIGRAGGDTDASRDYEYTDWAAVDRFARELGRTAPG